MSWTDLSCVWSEWGGILPTLWVTTLRHSLTVATMRWLPCCGYCNKGYLRKVTRHLVHSATFLRPTYSEQPTCRQPHIEAKGPYSGKARWWCLFLHLFVSSQCIVSFRKVVYGDSLSLSNKRHVRILSKQNQMIVLNTGIWMVPLVSQNKNYWFYVNSFHVQ